MQKKILIIDHDQDTVDILLYLFGDLGYAVTGFILIDIFTVLLIMPDLILMDTWLPGNIEGAICRQLKTDYRTQHIPIVLLSTQANIPDIANHCLADGYVGKPFELEHICKVVSDLQVLDL
jgi:CheY-like chemotaxis protein